MNSPENEPTNAGDPAKAKTKVLFTADSLGAGNAQCWILNLACRMSSKRFEPVVVAVKPLLAPDDVLLGAFQESDIPVFSLNLKHYELFFPLGTTRMKKLLKRIKPDVVQTTSLVDSFYAVRAAAALNTPVIASFRDTPDFADLPGFKRRIYLEHLESCDAVFAVSEYAKKILADEIPQSISVIYDFVHVDPFSPLKDRRFGEKQQFTLGIVSDFSLTENLSSLVNLFAELRQLLPFVKNLLIVGDGPERSAVEALVSQLGLSNSVIIVRDQADMTPFYERMDFYISTSKAEQLPLSMLEAMGYSVIPIVVGVGAIPEAVSDGVNGFLLDPQDMSENLRKLEGIFADCVKKPSKFTRMAKAARKAVLSKFSSNVIVPQYEKLLSRVAEASGTAE